MPAMVQAIGHIATFKATNPADTAGSTSPIVPRANTSHDIPTDMRSIVSVSLGFSAVHSVIFCMIGIIKSAIFCSAGSRAFPIFSNISSKDTFNFLICPSNVCACARADHPNSFPSSASITF
jgi:hypothetical protein